MSQFRHSYFLFFVVAFLSFILRPELLLLENTCCKNVHLLLSILLDSANSSNITKSWRHENYLPHRKCIRRFKVALGSLLPHLDNHPRKMARNVTDLGHQPCISPMHSELLTCIFDRSVEFSPVGGKRVVSGWSRGLYHPDRTLD